MRMVDLIEKKRDGLALTDEEIRFVIDGFTNGSIPDYQMSAFAMAVFFKGMTDHETAVLTDAMMRSGDTIDCNRSFFLFAHFVFSFSSGPWYV